MVNWTDEEKELIWNKAKFISYENEKKNGFRKNQCDAWIRKCEYGNRDSDANKTRIFIYFNNIKFFQDLFCFLQNKRVL